MEKQGEERDRRLDSLEEKHSVIIDALNNNTVAIKEQTEMLAKMRPMYAMFEKRQGFWATLKDWQGSLLLIGFFLLLAWMFLSFAYGPEPLPDKKEIIERILPK